MRKARVFGQLLSEWSAPMSASHHGRRKERRPSLKISRRSTSRGGSTYVGQG
jgi:hypothetical protein